MHETTSRRSGAMVLLEAVCAPCPPFEAPPRIAIVCAHPDDEVVGAGGRLPHLHSVDIIHITDGAPRDGRDAAALGFPTRAAYAEARREEKARALALAGVDAAQLHDAGLCDQEASYALVSLTRYLADAFDQLRPQVVLTHAYEGGHPDHDATAFAVHLAVHRLRVHRGDAPVLAEMTSYHARGTQMIVGEFLPGAGDDLRTVLLGEDERALKQQMFACYTTQHRVLAAFSTDVERFRLAPAYDFTVPPHDGELFYERFEWGVTGVQWRALAREALDTLQGSRLPPRC